MDDDIFGEYGEQVASQRYGDLDPYQESAPANKAPRRQQGTIPRQAEISHTVSKPWLDNSPVGEATSRGQGRHRSREEEPRVGFWGRIMQAFTGEPMQGEQVVDQGVVDESPYSETAGKSQHEIDLEIQDYITRMRMPVKPIRVAVFSKKGGCSKSTTLLGYANAVGRYSPYGIILDDGNSDRGTAGMSNGHDEVYGYDILDFIQYIDQIDSAKKVSRFTSKSQQSRLEVIASRRGSERSMTGEDYIAVIEKLQQFWPVVATDSGIDFTNPLTQAILDMTDVPIVCSTHSPNSIVLAKETIESFLDWGRDDLVARTIVCISETNPERPDRARITREFMELGVSDVEFIPYDRYIASPNTTLFLWEELSFDTQIAFMRLAAKVGDSVRKSIR